MLAVFGAALAGLTGALFVILLVHGCARPGGLLRGDFDAAVWRSNSIEERIDGNCGRDNPRGDMVDDLVGDHLRRGMSRDEIRSLLGSPDRTGSGWDYCLGMWSGFRIDYDWLSLSFDKGDRLTSWSVWQD
jgi:outer membrane protein assembly factor BamE (lipoprotein component of BamABCDE complex)